MKSVAILGFHKIGQPPNGQPPTWFYISEETFAAQLDVLKSEHWQVIDLSTFVRGLNAPETLPDRSALITFDDGCQSLTGPAMKWLTRFHFPAVVFVPTDFVGKTNAFDLGIEPVEPICDWGDLDLLNRSEISIQSHSASHPAFSKVDSARQRDELLRSKIALEKKLGNRVIALAFPYGDTACDPQLLRETGYAAAFGYGGGVARLPAADRFRLPRIAMGPDTDLHAELSK